MGWGVSPAALCKIAPKRGRGPESCSDPGPLAQGLLLQPLSHADAGCLRSSLLSQIRVEEGRGSAQQLARVGVLRVVEDVLRRAGLHALAAVHDHDTV